MRTLPKPTLTSSNSYSTCISRISDPALKARLSLVKDNLETASNDYDSKASVQELYQISTHSNVGGQVTQKEMKKLYENQLVPKKSPGRHIYDALRNSTDTCPFCGQLAVYTLDHYLPKKLYPSFSVNPLNLVPCCRDCNTNKLSDDPSAAGDQVLHPYYDDLITEQWLCARILPTTPASAEFYVSAPSHWGADKKARVKTHFDSFKLDVLYKSQVSTQITGMRYGLTNIFNKCGSQGVKEHLKAEEDSWRFAYVNSWQTALHQAMANDQWFYNGGFAQV